MDAYCTHCGSQMPNTANFCASCGRQAYHPTTEPRATERLQQPAPTPPDSVGAADGAALQPPTAESLPGPEKGLSESAVGKVAYAAVALYLMVVAVALVLHQHANAEAKIIRDVEEVQSQLSDLIFKRGERSPRMLELLKWPEGASDDSVDGFINRADELAPLLSNELAASKRVQEHALQVLAQVPSENPNHIRASLVAQATQDDVLLYESFLREVTLANKARSQPRGARADVVNSELMTLHVEENENLERRTETIEKLK